MLAGGLGGTFNRPCNCNECGFTDWGFLGSMETDWEASSKAKFCHPFDPNREKLSPCEKSRSLI